MSINAFAALGVPASLADLLAKAGIDTPTPIQAATLPDSLAGRDLLGRGRTGSGKTYAFLLPILARLAPNGVAPRNARTPVHPAPSSSSPRESWRSRSRPPSPRWLAWPA